MPFMPESYHIFKLFQIFITFLNQIFDLGLFTYSAYGFIACPALYHHGLGLNICHPPGNEARKKSKLNHLISVKGIQILVLHYIHPLLHPRFPLLYFIYNTSCLMRLLSDHRPVWPGPLRLSSVLCSSICPPVAATIGLFPAS